MERLVTTGALRYPDFRLVQAGARIEPSEYTVEVPSQPQPFTGVALVDRVVERWRRGATIVAERLSHHWPPLAALCGELELELGQDAGANAYLTPRDSQGLPLHHDTHDVFVLQVAGEKRWRIYEPVLELPLPYQRYTPFLGAPGEPALDVTLRPGDSLYLPRGFLHEALTSESDSLHVTIGVSVYTWLDAVQDAVASLGVDVELRREVPPDGAMTADLVGRIADALRPEAVAEAKRRHFVADRRPVLDGQLSQLRALDALGPDTLVARRPGASGELADGGLVFLGRMLPLAPAERAAVAPVVDAREPFAVRDLVGLDPETQSALARRLVEAGFLRVVG